MLRKLTGYSNGSLPLVITTITSLWLKVIVIQKDAYAMSVQAI